MFSLTTYSADFYHGIASGTAVSKMHTLYTLHNEKIPTNSDKTRFVISLAFSFARLVQVNSASTASETIIINDCLIFPFGFFLMEIFDFSRKA
jgi:hypothetical protein